MRFALLGADADSLALADAAVAAGHAIVWRDDVGDPDALAWEALLDSEASDAILVGAGGAAPDDRAKQIQELAKQGRPLLTVHPVVPSVISYFEIDMARGESGALVQHFNPLLANADVDAWAAWVRDGHPELRAIEQIAATRQMADRSREAVLWHVARDVELLAQLAGRFDRIGAHAAMGDPDAAYSSLSLQLLGSRQIPVRWSVEPASRGADLSVVLIFQRGRATVSFAASGVVTAIYVQSGAGESRERLSQLAPAANAVERFVAALKVGDGAASDWTAALDAMELADSIEISLRRGRMIDVHHRELTETLAFKGVMSALGCGVLVVLVPLVLVVGWIAGIVGIPLSDYWPHLLLVFLAAFLGLQLLPKLVLPSARRTASDAGAAGGENAVRDAAPADSAD